MARKAAATPARTSSTALATTNEQALALLREEESASIQDRIGAPASNKIKTKDKVFTFPDGTVEPGPIQLVVVDFVSRNALYEGKWDPNNPQPPVCFAIGKNIKDMAPSDNSEDKQHADCASCPNNAFGSDGNGKACKNTRLLAVLPPDATEEDEIMTLEVSPTGLKSFDGHVATVFKTTGVGPISVITEVAFHPERDYPNLTFRQAGPNTNLGAMVGRRAEAEVLLNREFEAPTPSDTAAKKKAPARRGAARTARRR